MQNKAFYRSLFAIVIPIAMQNIITFLVQILDTIMVGSLGDTAVSAVSLANQPYLIFNSLLLGLTGGGTILISQYWGKNDRKTIRNIMTLMVWLTLISSIIYSGICLMFPRQIMSIFSSDSLVIEQSIQYLKIVVLSYVLNGISYSYLAGLKAIENVKISTYIFSLSFLINLVFNYLLIFGKFNFPEMGINGAALGTVIARFFQCMVCFWYAKKREKTIKFTLKNLGEINYSILPVFAKISIPVIFHELNWSLASSAQVAIIGNLGSTFLTAESIAVIAQQLGMLFLYGVSSAAAIMIGKTIGQGDLFQANCLAKKFLKVSIFTGIVAFVIVLIIRVPLLMLYPNISVESKLLANQIMTVLAFITFFVSIEYTYTIGILRGAGDTTFAFIVDSGCMWLIGIPLGILAAFIWKLPFVFVFLCLKIDTIIKIILCTFRVFKGKYIKRIVNDVECNVEKEYGKV